MQVLGIDGLSDRSFQEFSLGEQRSSYWRGHGKTTPAVDP
jgi:hypothetical protein